MMSYIRDSDDVIKIFMLLRDYVLEYHPTTFGDDWTINKGETEGAQCAYRPIFDVVTAWQQGTGRRWRICLK